MAFDIYSAVTDRIIQQMEQGILPLSLYIAWKSYLAFSTCEPADFIIFI